MHAERTVFDPPIEAVAVRPVELHIDMCRIGLDQLDMQVTRKVYVTESIQPFADDGLLGRSGQ